MVRSQGHEPISMEPITRETEVLLIEPLDLFQQVRCVPGADRFKADHPIEYRLHQRNGECLLE